MSSTNVQIVQALLNATKDRGRVTELCAPDVTYVSLNYSNPDLKKIMPWCGTANGPQAIVDTFVTVSEYWNIDRFEPEAAFGEDENVAVFGKFTYTSTKLKKTITSPFAVYCKVVDGKVTYMQFMEDTFCTSSSFRAGGNWIFESDPQGGVVQI